VMFFFFIEANAASLVKCAALTPWSSTSVVITFLTPVIFWPVVPMTLGSRTLYSSGIWGCTFAQCSTAFLVTLLFLLVFLGTHWRHLIAVSTVSTISTVCRVWVRIVIVRIIRRVVTVSLHGLAVVWRLT
jgi:hypothetical protein